MCLEAIKLYFFEVETQLKLFIDLVSSLTQSVFKNLTFDRVSLLDFALK